MPSHPYTTNNKTAPTVSAPAKPERAHPRVRIPGVIELGGQRYRIHDVSLGGLCLEGSGLHEGEVHRGTLTLTLDSTVTLPVAAHVRNHDAHGNRTGIAFHQLGGQDLVTLRHAINAFLTGDPIASAEAPPAAAGSSSSSARNYAPTPAAAKLAPPPRQTSRLRALVTTAAFLGAAVVAFGYTARQVNRVVFASQATAAKVAGPTYDVRMPREGTFYSLVPEDGIVKKGAPIASFEAPVLDLVRNQTLGTNMTPENLQKLMKVTVKGTITSPCDCKVQTAFATDGQYVARDQQLFELMPRDFTPYVVARFRNDQLNDIATGDRVSFKVAGDPQSRFGKISQVRAHGQGDTVDTDVMVMIAPDEPIPAEMLSRPAEVIAGGFMLPDLSGGSATAKSRDP